MIAAACFDGFGVGFGAAFFVGAAQAFFVLSLPNRQGSQVVLGPAGIFFHSMCFTEACDGRRLFLLDLRTSQVFFFLTFGESYEQVFHEARLDPGEQ